MPDGALLRTCEGCFLPRGSARGAHRRRAPRDFKCSTQRRARAQCPAGKCGLGVQRCIESGATRARARAQARSRRWPQDGRRPLRLAEPRARACVRRAGLAEPGGTPASASPRLHANAMTRRGARRRSLATREWGRRPRHGRRRWRRRCASGASSRRARLECESVRRVLAFGPWALDGDRGAGACVRRGASDNRCAVARAVTAHATAESCPTVRPSGARACVGVPPPCTVAADVSAARP